jgi:hypothetical protein
MDFNSSHFYLSKKPGVLVKMLGTARSEPVTDPLKGDRST